MNWLRIVAGFLIMMGVVVIWFRWMRALRGRSDGLAPTSRPDRASHRERRPNELEQIIAAHRAASGTANAPRSGADTAAPALNVGTAAQRASPDTTAPVLLHGVQRLAYLLFRSGLRDHHVLARVPLGQLVAPPDAAAPGPEHVFAVVVCNPDFTVAAAIDIRDPLAGSHTRMVGDVLRRHGIRHIVLDPASLPRPRDVRALVHGT